MDASLASPPAGAAVEEQQQQQAQAAAALDICIQHCLKADDVVRLWASSRALQQLCSSRLSTALLVRSVADAAWVAALAQPVIAQAAVAARGAFPPWSEEAVEFEAALSAAAAADERRTTQALRWMLRQPSITAAMLNQCSQQLLAIPCVPLAAALALVRAGLRVQITVQQLVARAFECFQGFEVWVQAFVAAHVEPGEWAAELPADIIICCCRHIGGWLPDEQLVQDVEPARAEDLLAVALNIAARGCSPSNRSYRYPFNEDSKDAPIDNAYLLLHMAMHPLSYHAASQLPAAAIEALLRLSVRLTSITFNWDMVDGWPRVVRELCGLPAAAQLPTAALVELVQLVLQGPGGPYSFGTASFLKLLAGRQLTAEQLKALLSLLKGPTARPAAIAYDRQFDAIGGRSVMLWLASQPGAAAVAAGLGLTPADVEDPDAADLLFGEQQEASSEDAM